LLAYPLFEGVSRERVAPLISRAVIRTVGAGTVLHTPGERGRPMYLVLGGSLRAYQLTPDGRKLILEIIEPGGWDGLLPMLGQRGHFTEAAEDSEVACLDWSLIQQLSVADNRVMRNLVDLVARRLQGREEHLESMVIRDPTRRLARQLLALTRVVGDAAGDDRVALPRTITHQVLADMLGVRRETVTLHLADLEDRGAIERGRPLTVLRKPLQAIAESPGG
jgi:CRP/FNR family transcriptional regulator